MKCAIVTGANGFIGRHLVRELVQHDYFVYAVVRDWASDTTSLDGISNTEILRCAQNELNILPVKLKGHPIDVFYELAWEGAAGAARADCNVQLRNVQNAINSVNVCKELQCKRYVGAGSLMELEALHETSDSMSRPAMSNIYSCAKYTAHAMTKTVACSLGIEHIWGIITNAYGCNEKSPRFISATARKLVNKEPLLLTSAQQNYDFIHVTDVASAFRLLGEQGVGGAQYVIGSGHAMPLKQYVIMMRDILAPKAALPFGTAPFSGIELPLSAFDTCALQALGFAPQISFSAGIRELGLSL